MQIKETDLLWRGYCRAYHESTQPPHPHNLCNYWRTAVFGLVLKGIYDTPLWIVLFGVGALNGLASFIDSNNSPSEPAIACSCALLLTTVVLGLRFGSSIFRSVSGFTKRNNQWVGPSIVISCLLVIAALETTLPLISKLHYDSYRLPETIGMFEWLLRFAEACLLFIIPGILMIVVVFFCVWLCCRAEVSRAFSQTWQYVVSMKRHVCPLMKAPWEDPETASTKE